jgi:uncharacterized protein YqgV (UPF0045/DUF77 family)
MVFEVSVIPVGGDIQMSDELGDVLSVIDRSGLPYQLGPGSTCIEGEWDEVVPVLRECHQEARRKSRHVVTLVKIEDDEGQTGKLVSNVASVERKAGRPLATGTPGEGEERSKDAAATAKRRRQGDDKTTRGRRARA